MWRLFCVLKIEEHLPPRQQTNAHWWDGERWAPVLLCKTMPPKVYATKEEAEAEAVGIALDHMNPDYVIQIRKDRKLILKERAALTKPSWPL